MSIEILAEDPPEMGSVVWRGQASSRPDRKDPLIDEIVACFAAAEWLGPDDETWLRLCLEEVIANAMYHGNEGDPDLVVNVELAADDHQWVLTVSDQGQGFAAAAIPDGEDPEALLREHGRGLLIMHEWLDDLRYYRGGAVARLCRHIPSDDHPPEVSPS